MNFLNLSFSTDFTTKNVVQENLYSKEKTYLDSYRFGFNGQMKVNEMSGVGNYLDFGARMYDSRVGRLGMAIDPLFKKFPEYSPYLFAGNNPIYFIDKEGEFKLSPSIQQSYPLIYKYLSSQVEKDVMNSSLLKQAYKEINPQATDDNIRNIFKNNSGPVLTDLANPGGEYNAAGKTEYDQRGSTIEINSKIFEYVEGKLKSNDNKNNKQLALMYLYVVLNHEVAHEITGYNGTDKNGNDIRLSNNERDKKQNGDPGNQLENEVWGIPFYNSKYTDQKSDVIKGIKNSNPKNKEGIMENVIKNSSLSEQGQQTLPTVLDK